MPYTPKASRPGQTENVGELTYMLQNTIMVYLEQRSQAREFGYLPDIERELHFSDLGEVVAALECCKIDFVDRILLPYEHRKCAENGDVWHATLLRKLGIETT